MQQISSKEARRIASNNDVVGLSVEKTEPLTKYLNVRDGPSRGLMCDGVVCCNETLDHHQYSVPFQFAIPVLMCRLRLQEQLSVLYENLYPSVFLSLLVRLWKALALELVNQLTPAFTHDDDVTRFDDVVRNLSCDWVR